MSWQKCKSNHKKALLENQQKTSAWLTHHLYRCGPRQRVAMCNRFTRHSMPKSRAFDNQRVVRTSRGSDAGETIPIFFAIALRA